MVELWRSSPDQFGKSKRLNTRQRPPPMAMVAIRSFAIAQTLSTL